MHKIINGWTKAKMIEAIQTGNNGTKAVNAINGCQYYINGNKCAIGCFLPNAKSYETIEYPISKLVQEYPVLRLQLPLHLNGLAELQVIHDDSPSTIDPRPRLIEWINTFCKESCDGCDDLECQQCCSHQWDMDEGGMCINCGREDYYNFIDEDYGKD